LNSFQKYLSYFIRIVVEKKSSNFNPGLIVAIQDGKYVLNSKNANYSFASLHRVFQQALTKVEITKKNIDSVLVLGCGAGSIPSIIYNELKLSPLMDAVEIDAKVVELGNKYFGLNEYERLNVIIDDATNFIKITDKKYDLILVDLFKGINVPEEFLTQPFFNQLKSLTNKGGDILINFVAYNHETKLQAKTIEEILNKVFLNKCNVYTLESINRIFHIKN